MIVCVCVWGGGGGGYKVLGWTPDSAFVKIFIVLLTP